MVVLILAPSALSFVPSTGDTPYQTAIPAALDDQQLATRLESHGVRITAVPASSGVGEIVTSLAPLPLFVGLFWWLGSRAAGATQLATRMVREFDCHRSWGRSAIPATGRCSSAANRSARARTRKPHNG